MKQFFFNLQIYILSDCFSVTLTLLHSERPKLYTILAFLSAIGLRSRFLSKAQLINMSKHMASQSSFLIKSFPTNFTAEGFVSSMYPLMPLQVGFEVKRFSTNVACKWSITHLVQELRRGAVSSVCN